MTLDPKGCKWCGRLDCPRVAGVRAGYLSTHAANDCDKHAVDWRARYFAAVVREGVTVELNGEINSIDDDVMRVESDHGCDSYSQQWPVLPGAKVGGLVLTRIALVTVAPESAGKGE